MAFSTYSMGTPRSASPTASSAWESPRNEASGACLAGFCRPDAVVHTATTSGRSFRTISVKSSYSAWTPQRLEKSSLRSGRRSQPAAISSRSLALQAAAME